MDTTWKIGDLVWVPKHPLSLYSTVGNTDFWKLGIITSIDSSQFVSFFYNDHFEQVHVNHIRKTISNP